MLLTFVLPPLYKMPEWAKARKKKWLTLGQIANRRVASDLEPWSTLQRYKGLGEM